MLSFQEYLVEKITTSEIESKLWDAVHNAVETRSKPQMALRKELKAFLDELFPTLKKEIRVRADAKEREAFATFRYNKTTNEPVAVILEVRVKKEELQRGGIGTIVSTLMHEITHIYQFYSSNFQSILRAHQKELDPSNVIAYLSSKQEIEAFAVGAISEVIGFAHQHNFLSTLSLDKFMKQMTQSQQIIKSMTKVSPSIRSYWEYFGKHDDDKDRQEVWKRFLKKLYQHMQDRLDS